MLSRLVLTPGEPAGVGPDLVVQWAQTGDPRQVIVVADPVLLRERAQQLGLPLTIQLFQPTQPRASAPNQLTVWPVALKAASQPGRLDPANGPYVLETLHQAVALCQQGIAQGIVTGPVHKGIINEAGLPFTGHTEYLADLTHTPQVVMMLAVPELRVALATTHLPLAAVSQAITRPRLTAVLRVLHHGLVRFFGLPQPRILVCGLNPHAGEGGHLGQEELMTIQPVLAELRQEGMNLRGPLPADTAFAPHQLAEADVVLAMYHDQGLPVLKHRGFGRAVNVTLGLPFLRTSVDHGTALDLAGTGRAHLGSLEAALALARQLVV